MLKQEESKVMRTSSMNTYMSAGSQDGVMARNEGSVLTLQVGSQLDPGIRRKDRPNEDRLAFVQGSVPASTQGRSATPFVLLVVADGMGGMGNGQQASQLAVETLVQYVQRSFKTAPRGPEDLTALLQKGVQQANRAVYKRNEQQDTMMGTTITAALIYGTSAYVANVGDSRLYYQRASAGLKQITMDHSLVAMLAKQGIIEPEEIYTHPGRNQIYRNLGSDEKTEVDTFVVPLYAGDTLLLGSDGLWEMVHDPQLAAILTESVPSVQQTADHLVQAALANGGDDNVSTIVARVL